MEPRWLIGGPQSTEKDEPEEVNPPQQAEPRNTLTHKGKTAAQWRLKAELETACGTPDGRLRAKSYELHARLAETGGIWEFPALFTPTGALVPQATWVKTARGKWVWRIGVGQDVSWFDPSKALTGDRRYQNDRAKGFVQGTIRARAYVGTVERASGVGFYIARYTSSAVEIVDNGCLRTRYQDK